MGQRITDPKKREQARTKALEEAENKIRAVFEEATKKADLHAHYAYAEFADDLQWKLIDAFSKETEGWSFSLLLYELFNRGYIVRGRPNDSDDDGSTCFEWEFRMLFDIIQDRRRLSRREIDRAKEREAPEPVSA